MPAKGRTTLTENQKQTIVALRIQGVSNRTIAVKLGLHPITVSKAYSEFRRESSLVVDDLGEDWKRDVKILAVRAVKRGLKDESDIHKSGILGVQALKGLNEFVSGNHLQVDGSVNLTVSWGAVQEPEADDAVEVDTRLISD